MVLKNRGPMVLKIDSRGAPSLAGAGCSNEAFVHLHRAGELVAVWPKHGSAQPMEHGPGGLVRAETELPLELYRGETRSDRADEVGGLEPLHERHAGAVQHRPRSCGSLSFATLALPQPPLRQHVGGLVLAPRTPESVWPSRLCQVPCARLLLREPGLELGKRSWKRGARHIGNLRRWPFRSQSDKHVPEFAPFACDTPTAHATKSSPPAQSGFARRGAPRHRPSGHLTSPSLVC